MMKRKFNAIQKIGGWSFIAGLIIALLAGLWPLRTASASTLIILGLIIGFLNVTGNEKNNFLFATLILVIMSSMGSELLKSVKFIGPMLANIFAAIVLFVIPAAIVVALKSIYTLAESD